MGLVVTHREKSVEFGADGLLVKELLSLCTEHFGDDAPTQLHLWSTRLVTFVELPTSDPEARVNVVLSAFFHQTPTCVRTYGSMGVNVTIDSDEGANSFHGFFSMAVNEAIIREAFLAECGEGVRVTDSDHFAFKGNILQRIPRNSQMSDALKKPHVHGGAIDLVYRAKYYATERLHELAFGGELCYSTEHRVVCKARVHGLVVVVKDIDKNVAGRGTAGDLTLLHPHFRPLYEERYAELVEPHEQLKCSERELDGYEDADGQEPSQERKHVSLRHVPSEHTLHIDLTSLQRLLHDDDPEAVRLYLCNTHAYRLLYSTEDQSRPFHMSSAAQLVKECKVNTLEHLRHTFKLPLHGLPHVAVLSDSVDMLRWADKHCSNFKNFMANGDVFVTAVSAGKLHSVRYLLELEVREREKKPKKAKNGRVIKQPVKLMERKWQGCTALGIAVQGCHVDAVRLLLEWGACREDACHEMSDVQLAVSLMTADVLSLQCTLKAAQQEGSVQLTLHNHTRSDVTAQECISKAEALRASITDRKDLSREKSLVPQVESILTDVRERWVMFEALFRDDLRVLQPEADGLTLHQRLQWAAAEVLRVEALVLPRIENT